MAAMVAGRSVHSLSFVSLPTCTRIHSFTIALSTVRWRKYFVYCLPYLTNLLDCHRIINFSMEFTKEKNKVLEHALLRAILGSAEEKVIPVIDTDFLIF